jgi:hypothetical protein
MSRGLGKLQVVIKEGHFRLMLDRCASPTYAPSW